MNRAAAGLVLAILLISSTLSGISDFQSKGVGKEHATINSTSDELAGFQSGTISKASFSSGGRLGSMPKIRFRDWL